MLQQEKWNVASLIHFVFKASASNQDLNLNSKVFHKYRFKVN